jgi:hypothetical protein
MQLSYTALLSSQSKFTTSLLTFAPSGEAYAGENYNTLFEHENPTLFCRMR